MMVVAANKMLDECLSANHKYTMNVVLLEDNTYEWSRPFVQAAVEKAIEEDRLANDHHGMDHGSSCLHPTDNNLYSPILLHSCLVQKELKM